MIVQFTIDDAKIQKIIDTTKYFWPIPQIPDPAWIDPEDGSTAPLINQFTDVQWAKEGWRRHIIEMVKKYEYETGMNILRSELVLDNTLVT